MEVKIPELTITKLALLDCRLQHIKPTGEWRVFRERMLLTVHRKFDDRSDRCFEPHEIDRMVLAIADADGKQERWCWM